jgi:hypothetical protein
MFKFSIISNVLKKTLLFLSSTVPLMLLTHVALAAEAEDYLAKANVLAVIKKNMGYSSELFWGVFIIILFGSFWRIHESNKYSWLLVPLSYVIGFPTLMHLIPG